MDHIKIVVRLANAEHQILYKIDCQDNQRESCNHACHIIQYLTLSTGRKRRDILKWLSVDDYEETHERHFRKQYKGTGKWLLEDPRLIHWRDGAQSSLLWCHGARK